MATSSRIQAVERATGRSWDEWLEYLTRIGAPEMTHHFAACNPDVDAPVEGEVRVSGTENRVTWRAKAREGESVIVISEPKKNGTALARRATSRVADTRAQRRGQGAVAGDRHSLRGRSPSHSPAEPDRWSSLSRPGLDKLDPRGN